MDEAKDSARSIKVLVADDHRIMREGFRTLLEKEPDMEVVGEAESGQATVDLAKELKPEVVVMELSMFDLNGVEATRQILDNTPGIKVLVLSLHPDKQFVTGVLNAGASGYLLKDCAFEELVQAIHIVVAGQTYISPGINTAAVD